jgi:hypothetical protein
MQHRIKQIVGIVRPVDQGSKSASIAVRRERSEKIDDPRAVRADDDPAQRRYHPR